MLCTHMHFIFLRRNHEWINFDDEISIDIKMSALRNTSAAGVFLWDITADDFLGLCGIPHSRVAFVHEHLISQQVVASEVNVFVGNGTNKLE